ncbi:MAG: hypothetical protein AAB295_02110, partial [Chloroflexota bacterium]
MRQRAVEKGLRRVGEKVKRKLAGVAVECRVDEALAVRRSCSGGGSPIVPVRLSWAHWRFPPPSALLSRLRPGLVGR